MNPDFLFIDNDGVRLRVAVTGSGPLFLFVHGFPESWYSWRYQMAAVTAAGFRAAALDVRGYGGSDAPSAVPAYRMEMMVSDIVAVAHALQPDQPVILVGHDWGAPMVYATALSRPEAVAAVAGLAVPYGGIPPRPFDDWYEERYISKGRFFYQHWFAQQGAAEAEAEADVRRYLLAFYATLDAKAAPWPDRKVGESALAGLPADPALPNWLTVDDLDYYAAQFARSGFAGPFGRYRNHQADYHWYQQFRGWKIEQPALFVGGAQDMALNMAGYSDPLARMREDCPGLVAARILDACGHWTQQEQPEMVNAILLEWLGGL